MEEHDLQYELKRSTVEELDRISSYTQFPISIIPNSNLVSKCAVELADVECIKTHRIYWNPTLIPSNVVNHIILHGLSRIRRWWQCLTSDKFKLPCYAAEQETNALSDIRDHTVRLSLSLNRSHYSDYVQSLRLGLLQQLFDTPLDLRVEREIYNFYPDNRDIQRHYLCHESRIIQNSSPIQMKSIPPNKVMMRSQAMTYAYVKGLDQIVGENNVDTDNFQPIVKDFGKRIYKILSNTNDTGHLADRQVIDSWATTLQMEDWFFWKKPKYNRANG